MTVATRKDRRVYRSVPRPPAGHPTSERRAEARQAGGRRRSAGLLLASTLGVGLATQQLAVLAVAAWREVMSAGASPAATDPVAADALVSAVSASAATLLCGWLLLGVLLSCLEVLTSPTSRAGRAAGRCSRRVAPAVLRHGVAALLGVTLGVGTLTAAVLPANAANAPSTSQTSQAGRTSSAGPAVPAAVPPAPIAGLSPGWTPTRPRARHTAVPAATSTPGVRALRPRAQAELGDEVVVRRGDTLWALAARHLGRDASDAQIALEWPTWFSANRSAIGDDPDLLRPGTRLRVPEQGGAR